MQEPVLFPLSPNDYINVVIGIKNVRLGCSNACIVYVVLNSSLSADYLQTTEREFKGPTIIYGCSLFLLCQLEP